MKLFKVVAMMCLILGQGAYAYERCQTESNGYRFSGGGFDFDTAMQMAINECTSSRYTNNGTCRGNIKCEDYSGQFQLAQIRCEARSNGYTFVGGAQSMSEAVADVERSCTASRYTNNGECRASIKCESATARPSEVNVNCTTRSNGYTFQGGAFDLESAISDAVSSCTGSRYTTNGDCRAEVACSYPNSRRTERVNWSCETRSNGYKFKGGNRERNGAMEDAISACTGSRYTSNGECYSNISCKAPELNRGGVVVRPLPPVVVGPSRPRINFRVESLQMAERVITLVESFEAYVNADDYINVMLPLKKQAGRLSARVSGRAEYIRVKNTLVQLGVLLADSENFIEDNMERAALFQASKELLTMREKVRSLVNFMDEFDGDVSTLY